MADDRRNFIKKFGAMLGSLIVSGSLPGCGPRKEGDLSGAKREVTTQSEPSPNTQTLSAPEWKQVRQCWLSLKTLNEDVHEALRSNVDRRVKGAMTTEELIALQDTIPRKRIRNHQAALDTLVATAQIDAPVARDVQVAFEEATYHLVRSRATCYMGLPLEHAPRRDLLQQADVLSRISADLDPETVAKAQAAIAQDIAFFETFETFSTFKTVTTLTVRPSNHAQLHGDYEAGNLKASPEALEAARLLTLLFAGTPD